jgi:hypothetical protein
MESYHKDRLWLINASIAEEVRRAEANRLGARPARSIRRAIGTSIVRLGTRRAGEPTYELARSR